MLSNENILVAQDELRISSTEETTIQRYTFEQNAMSGRCAHMSRLSITTVAVTAREEDAITTKVRLDAAYRKQLLT